jgi:hypothetical protein
VQGIGVTGNKVSAKEMFDSESESSSMNSTVNWCDGERGFVSVLISHWVREV